MHQITIITGKQGVGKTSLCRLITADKETIFVSGNFSIKNLMELTENTKYIVFEDVTPGSYLNSVKELARMEVIKIRRPYEHHAQSYRVPDIIVTTQESFDPAIIRRSNNNQIFNLI